MATFNSFEALMKSVKKSIVPDIQENEVFETVKEVYQEHMDTDVYNAYKPKEYIRRYADGGLIADKNVVKEIHNCTLEVKAVAPLNTSSDYKMPNSTYLAELLEYGNDDAYGEAWANPRPFTENTIQDLRKSKQHIQAMKKGFARHGIGTK